MAPLNHYGNYYDPVGSHATQTQGYTYQTSAVSQAPYLTSTTSTYQTPSYENYNSAYGGQQHSNTAQQPQTTNNANRAAAAVLSTIGTQGYSHPGSTDRSTGIPNQYNGPNASAGYNQTSGRVQSSRSPLYSTNDVSSSSGRFGTQARPSGEVNSYNDPQRTYYQAVQSAGQTQGFNTAQASSSYSNNQAYQKSRSKRPANAPPRYNSPLQAIQDQQNRNPRPSRSSAHQASPQTTSRDVQQMRTLQRQQSESVDPSPATVDPAQVYDFRAEQYRKAEMEVQRRKRVELEETARKAAEDARQAETEQADQEKRRAEEEVRQAGIWKQQEEEERARKAAAKKWATQEQQRKVREERRQSDSAASVLQQISSGDASSSASTGAGMQPSDAALDDEEVQMRAMFKRMREFNQRNPAMLAKLWEEERQAHVPSTPARPSATISNTATLHPPRGLVNDKLPTKTSPKSKGSLEKTSMTASMPLIIDDTPGALQNNSELPAGAPATIPLQYSHVPAPKARSTPAPLQQATTTHWPAHKKGMLADATAKWLNNLPANRAGARTMPKEAIIKILDSNPSYAQLCESIEKSGIMFERSALARELLKVVPDGLRSQTVQKAESNPLPDFNKQSEPLTLAISRLSPNGQTHKANSTIGYRVPTFAPLSNAARDANNTYAMQSTPGLEARAIPGTYQRPYHAINRNDKIEVKTEAERNTRASPADKEEAARKRTFSDLVDLTQGDSDDDMPPRKILQTQPIPWTPNTHQPPPPPPPMMREPITYQQFQQPRHQGAWPNPIHAFSPAPPKLSNSSAQSSVPNVVPPPKPKGPTAEQLQSERMRGKMLVEPLMRDRVARKSRYDSRSIARDVLLATGRHPDLRPLNAHLNTLDKLLSTHGGATDGIGNKSDLSTIRWDIIDPGEPLRPDHSVDKSSVDDQYEIEDAKDTEVFVGLSGRSAEPKRRGRPPNSTKHQNKEFGSPARSQTPKSQPTMSSNTTPAVGYAAFRQVDEYGNAVKKKGRPVGWRKNIHSREAHGLTPTKSLSDKKSHTPKRPGAGINELELQQPHYQVFRCRWSGCPSELHNLEVLKKHVVKVHGRPNTDGVYECAWIECSAYLEHADPHGAGLSATARFDGIEAWMQHVDKQHLRDIAWEQGDGPRGGSLSDQAVLNHDSASSYLTDSHGRSVTPIIQPELADATRESSPMWFSGRQSKRSLSEHERKAAEELRELEESKKAEGPLMGTEGTRLANVKRRLGFLDDEDFADEVESSELGED